MQFTIFSIPYFSDTIKEQELNTFLRTHKIVTVTKELVTVANEAYWSFCVRWLAQNMNSKAPKTDYTEQLTKEEFIQYEKLKVTRKKLAVQLGIPAYAVFTNKELSSICKLQEITAKELLKIEGIGSGKLEKIGNQFIVLYHEKS